MTTVTDHWNWPVKSMTLHSWWSMVDWVTICHHQKVLKHAGQNINCVLLSTLQPSLHFSGIQVLGILDCSQKWDVYLSLLSLIGDNISLKESKIVIFKYHEFWTYVEKKLRQNLEFQELIRFKAKACIKSYKYWNCSLPFFLRICESTSK